MLQRCLVVILAMVSTAWVWAGDDVPRRSHVLPSNAMERYLSKQKLDYIRPGLNIDIESYEVDGNQLSVVVKFYDDRQQPLDRAGNVTPGSISMSFVLAKYDGQSRSYYAYTKRTANSSITGNSAEQASSDSGGSWEDLALGRARYTFGTALPSDMQMDKTHTIYIYATRNLSDIIGKNYYENEHIDFRPDGGQVTEVWDAISNDTCNQCHDNLALHGGSRQDMKLCVTCHSPQTSDPDTGNTVDFKEMIHKIHMGEHLPSVQAGTPYQIIGFRNSVHDYSEVVFPREIRKCTTCHSPEAAEGHIYLTRPSRAACGSCHDNINWLTGEGHSPGAQSDDSACASCHIPEGEFEFDNSVLGAHTIPSQSKQLAGLHAEILGVNNSAPGEFPEVTFRLTNNDGTIVDPSSLDRLNILMAGPNSDYTNFMSQNAIDATFEGNTATVAFSESIPADASGSWTASADIYRWVNIEGRNGEPLRVRESASNPVVPFAVTDVEPVARRQAVNISKCNDCHDALALHGGQRSETLECVMCHTPSSDDSRVRPEDQMPPESIDFKYLVHKIHTGEALNYDFTVYGYRSSVHNYNHVLFPGDRRNCEHCHDSGTYGLPLQDGLLPTETPRDFFTPMQPATAACLACHDTKDAAAHAFVNTAPFGESCASCHGSNREFSVEKVHAR